MTKQMDMENCFTLMEMFTKETGRMIKQMGMESIFIQMEQPMKVNGYKTSNKD
jgi:hypothetical protein